MTCQRCLYTTHYCYCAESSGDGVPSVFASKHSPGDEDSVAASSISNNKTSRTNDIIKVLSASIEKHGESLIKAAKMAALQHEKDRIHSFCKARRNLGMHLASSDAIDDAKVTRVISEDVEKINAKCKPI